ncbi:hypothetical protein M3J09_000795 [Ascochyta lentis]
MNVESLVPVINLELATELALGEQVAERHTSSHRYPRPELLPSLLSVLESPDQMVLDVPDALVLVCRLFVCHLRLVSFPQEVLLRSSQLLLRVVPRLLQSSKSVDQVVVSFASRHGNAFGCDWHGFGNSFVNNGLSLITVVLPQLSVLLNRLDRLQSLVLSFEGVFSLALHCFDLRLRLGQLELQVFNFFLRSIQRPLVHGIFLA